VDSSTSCCSIVALFLIVSIGLISIGFCIVLRIGSTVLVSLNFLIRSVKGPGSGAHLRGFPSPHSYGLAFRDGLGLPLLWVSTGVIFNSRLLNSVSLEQDVTFTPKPVARFIVDAFEMVDNSNILTEDRFARTRRHLATNSGKSGGLPSVAANHLLAEVAARHRCAEHRFHQVHPGRYDVDQGAEEEGAEGVNHPWRRFVTLHRSGRSGVSIQELSARWGRW
jgi:hypothetical protein